MNRFLFFLTLLSVVNFYAQQTHYVDFKTANASIEFGSLDKNEIGGKISYKFQILKDTDSIFLDAKDFSNIECLLNNASIDVLYNGIHLVVKHDFKKNSSYILDVIWKTSPKKALYFVNKGDEKQVWTQGQGKYTSNWLPSIDDMNEKIEFDLSIVVKNTYQVIANGKLIGVDKYEGFNRWNFNMQQPMSSYLVALAIGKYSKKVEISKSGIPLEMYYYPEDSLKFEPTYRFTKQMFDFLEQEIGVPYPWQNYKQVPVKDFLYAGMENTSTTIFADSFVIDSIAFIDKNYVNVNAHELAHQWFGDMVTETSGTHHWLQEGFATYYALLAEKEVFGADYYYWRLYEYAQELLEQDQAGQSTSLLDPKSSSTTFYKKGAWVLHILREKIGEKAFKKGVKNYLINNEFKNVETNDFISEVEKASGQNLSEFVEVWLNSANFEYEIGIESLKKSKFIDEYLAVDCKVYNSKCDAYLSSKISDEAKIKVISQNPNLVKKEDFNNSLKVRQAIAQNIEEIPLDLKNDYESLLMDNSYTTIESALYPLMSIFSEDRSKYLKTTKGIQGFNDKNVRILWLTFALITKDFEPENKQIYFQELINYTNPIYAFEIRQNAFLYLQQINACNDVCLDNLKQATGHYNWQFSKFAKTMLELINNNQK